MKTLSFIKMELNKFICGDAVTEMKKLPDGFFDLIVTSPPYNIKKLNRQWIEGHPWKQVGRE